MGSHVYNQDQADRESGYYDRKNASRWEVVPYIVVFGVGVVAGWAVVMMIVSVIHLFS